MAIKKRYLVTGNLGFIGYNFVNYLFRNGLASDVIGFDKGSNISIGAPVFRSRGDKFSQVMGHTKENDLLFGILKHLEIDYLVDFAASSHVDMSIENPDLFIEDNICGKHGVLRASRQYQNINPEFILMNISTDEVFGFLQNGDEPFTEESKYNPTNPYAASKAAGDHLVDSYVKTFGLNAITSHSCNNFGRYQDNSKFIPKVIENALLGKDIPVYGQGRQMREWIFVEDKCHAIDFLLRYGASGEHYNIGSGFVEENLSIVGNILSIISDMYGIDINKLTEQVKFTDDRLAHDFKYEVNTSKISSLGWEANHNFFKNIRETIEWYRIKLESQSY